MKHSDLQDLLSAYADGELARTQREFVERHAADCSLCQAMLADYKRDRLQLASLRSTPIPSDLKQAAMSKIRAAQALNRLFPRLVSPALVRPALIVASVLVAVIAIGILQLSGAGTIEKSEAATAALRSYRAIESVTVTKYGEIFQSEMEIEYSAPDRFRVIVGEPDDAVEFIGIGDDRYVRGESRKSAYIHVRAGVGKFLDEISGQAKSDDTTGLAMSKENTLEILGSLLDLEQLPDDMIDGHDTLRYQGTIDWGKIGRESLANKRSKVELWIDKVDYTIRQAKVEIAVLEENPVSQAGEWLIISSHVKYFDLNQPIEIKPPVTSSGEIEPGWSLVDTNLSELEKRKHDDIRKR